MGQEGSPRGQSSVVRGQHEDVPKGRIRYVARVTTLFHFPNRDVDLVTGEPVDDLPEAQLNILQNLGFVEPSTEDL